MCRGDPVHCRWPLERLGDMRPIAAASAALAAVRNPSLSVRGTNSILCRRPLLSSRPVVDLDYVRLERTPPQASRVKRSATPRRGYCFLSPQRTSDRAPVTVQKHLAHTPLEWRTTERRPHVFLLLTSAWPALDAARTIYTHWDLTNDAFRDRLGVAGSVPYKCREWPFVAGKGRILAQAGRRDCDAASGRVERPVGREAHVSVPIGAPRCRTGSAPRAVATLNPPGATSPIPCRPGIHRTGRY